MPRALQPSPGPSADATGSWDMVASFDGTRIAWRADGPDPGHLPGPDHGHLPGPDHGHLPVILCNGIACDDAYWREVVAPLSRDRRVLRWHYRGHGRSAPPANLAATGVPAVIADLRAVLNAAEVDEALLVGHSFGVQVCLEAARALGPRIRGIVAVAGAPGEPLGALLGRNAGDLLFPALERLMTAAPAVSQDVWRRWWGSVAVYWAARALRGTSAAAPREVLSDYFRHVEERDLGVLLAMFRSMQYHRVAPEEVSAPLLVLAGDADGLTPLELMTDMAARARAELRIVRGGSHTLPAEHPEEVLAAVRDLADAVEAHRR